VELELSAKVVFGQLGRHVLSIFKKLGETHLLQLFEAEPVQSEHDASHI